MSRTFAIIGCSATKKEGIAPAGELYCSDLFNKKKQWCQAKGIPHYVLSSCYGLLAMDREIQAYDIRITQLEANRRAAWAWSVRSQIVDRNYGPGDKCLFLAGTEYLKPLEGHFVGLKIEVVRPLAGKAIGQQKKWLKYAIEEINRLRCR